MEATSGGGIGVRCAQAASILTSINEKLQAAHVADVDKGTLIADVAMLKAFTAAGASLDEISPAMGARHSWAEIEARGRTIREDFAAEYGLTLPLVAIDLGRWDKGDGPFEAVAR